MQPHLAIPSYTSRRHPVDYRWETVQNLVMCNPVQRGAVAA